MEAPMTRKERAKRRAPSRKYSIDPLYGRIPLIAREVCDLRGGLHVVYVCDPDYEPSLPRGAVRADLRRQNLCFACHVPKYFYMDEEQTCVQCSRPFVFGAAEQKFWYESLGFYGASVPIRCPECRRQRRSEKALRAQVALARSHVQTNPENPAALLALAEAVVRHRQRTGQGDLNEAIAASRRARKLAPLVAETLFWEALCHSQAGRPEKARALFQQFASYPVRSKRDRDLRVEAMALLDAGEPSDTPADSEH
jgi:hypothetical protein